jgi:hypothetical protein
MPVLPITQRPEVHKVPQPTYQPIIFVNKALHNQPPEPTLPISVIRVNNPHFTASVIKVDKAVRVLDKHVDKEAGGVREDLRPAERADVISHLWVQ